MKHLAKIQHGRVSRKTSVSIQNANVEIVSTEETLLASVRNFTPSGVLE
jgi:hypothetical protein